VQARRNTANIDSWLAKLDNKSVNQQEVQES
jgi:hypothetical protein